MFWKVLREVLRVAKNATIIIPLVEGMYNQIKETFKYQAIKKKLDEITLKQIEEENKKNE